MRRITKSKTVPMTPELFKEIGVVAKENNMLEAELMRDGIIRYIQYLKKSK